MNLDQDLEFCFRSFKTLIGVRDRWARVETLARWANLQLGPNKCATCNNIRTFSSAKCWRCLQDELLARKRKTQWLHSKIIL